MDVDRLFHVTHLDNLKSICTLGLLPRNQLNGTCYMDISMAEVQQRRDDRWIEVRPDQRGPDRVRNIHDMVPLFINPKNPMTFVRREMTSDLCLLVISAASLCDGRRDIVFTDGNVACGTSRTYVDFDRLERLPWDVLRAPYWNDYEDGGRKRGAEFLVWPSVQLADVEHIEVPNAAARFTAIGQVGAAFEQARIIVEGGNFFR